MNNHPSGSIKKYVKWALVILVILIVGGLIVGIRWATYTRPPLAEAVNALQSNELVSVSTDPWLTFTPIQNALDTGFIFYPGGRVDPRGYATSMRVIAENGFLVIVPKMPINMAIFDTDAADEVMAAYPKIEKWVIGGHSVGGTAAAQYIDQHPDKIAGLAIWASYPADYTDISDLNIPVISIYGSQEIRVNDNSVGERKELLPEDTRYIVVEGGDHHQFGSYKIDPSENLATTQRIFQQQQIIQATLDLLTIVSTSP